MSYRQLSRDEIIQLGRELEDLARWEGARDYVSALYGLEARKPAGLTPHQITLSLVTIPVTRRRFEETAEIVVTDAKRRFVPFDLSRSWWSQFVLSEDEIATLQADKSGKLEYIRGIRDGDVYNALRDLCGALLGISFREHPEPRAPITFTYALDTPPSVNIPAVYVAE